MSRAFVSESDSQFQEEDVPAIKIPLPPGGRNYMTPQGARAVQEELQQLAQQERPRLAAAVQRLTSGAEPGDQAELDRGRRRLREIDRRIEYLTRMMAVLEVVEPAEGSPERVVFGAVVTVREEDRGEREYRIVGVDESDPEKGRVSWISPVARALTGSRVGDQVVLRLPSGETRLQVLEIRGE
jgi:transcription elongation factor GreB